MTTRTRHGFHGSVFKHTFAQFMGLRDRMAALYSDARFVESESNLLCRGGILYRRTGSVPIQQFDSQVYGIVMVNDLTAVAAGGALYIQEGGIWPFDVGTFPDPIVTPSWEHAPTMPADLEVSPAPVKVVDQFEAYVPGNVIDLHDF